MVEVGAPELTHDSMIYGFGAKGFRQEALGEVGSMIRKPEK